MRRPMLLAAAAVLVATAVPARANASAARVAALQVALWHAHLYRSAIDGVAGPLTRHAVVAFQRRKHLAPDGVAGPRTRRALGRYGRPALGRRLVRVGMVGWDVSELQFLLRKRGFSNGPLSGRFDRQTDALVRSYQRSHALEPDGLVGRLTLRSLRHRELRRVRLRRGVAIRTEIDLWARHYGVDVRLAKSPAWMEAGYHWNVTSPSAAWGIFQIEPDTWRYAEDVLLRRHVARTTVGNIRIGVLYLRHLIREFGSEQRALAAWYEGPRALRHQGISRATRIFVADVVALKRRF